ncbi:bifunctional diguanylate cyclase/phosphodiesterase [Pseudomonas asuensis]|uniref:Bifunctional diguanylate cyclase/phosphodiesterase n=1 Tax=Pseudomonas asuensis TaxID=1825787 RepID=A0ABQ2H2J4_9PSED|nr:EAL domain-containing protein [Pseudomonas asuensis]GGM24730.1 bifunctional diguanylate cyclase/phosphodiesterase [Pseudomonas asuensis]
MLSTAFTRRVFPLVTALLFLMFTLTCGLLIHNARSQDKQAQADTLYAAQKALEDLDTSIKKAISDYAKWGELYRNMHLKLNVNWAYDGENLGESIYELYGFQGLLVLNPQDETVYSLFEGEQTPLDAKQWIQGDLEGLLNKARASENKDEVLSQLLKVDGIPAIVAAGSITPGKDPTVKERPGPQSVLLFVHILTPDKLKELGTQYGLINLRTTLAPQIDGSSTLQLSPDADSYLAWDPPRHGKALLDSILPFFGIAGLMLIASTWLVLRNALATAKLMEAHYRELTRSKEALAISEERFRDVAEAASDWLWEVDAKYCLTYLSGRFEEVTGTAPDLWIGKSLDELLSTNNEPLTIWLSHQKETSGSSPLVCHYHDRQGKERTCRVSARPIKDGTQGFRGTASDITDEVKALAQIKHLSLHDSLTDLPNRNRLNDFLNKHVGSSTRLAPVALLSIDLDRFKPVNDALGHAAGDRVLREVAKRLRNCIREADLVARIGGDEFIVVMTRVQGHEEISALSSRIIDQLHQPIRIEEQTVFIGGSIGVALAPSDTDKAEELLRLADIALYQSKAAGRNTWRFYSHEMNELIISRRRLESDLRQALERDELSLHFQPRYSLTGDRLTGFEALLRWHHPEHGLLMPDRFIALAEDTGLIVPIGNWVLMSACKIAASWPQPVGISVNLSPRQFGRHDLINQVQHALTESGLDSSRLELEITERVMLDDADGALETLNSLKALGLRLHMDDFGTGFSSLGYLRSYPFDGIKIDRSFVAGIGKNPDDRAIVQAIITLGQSLGMIVTAEGVETAEQLERLRGDACDEVQGFHFSKALPAHELSLLFGQ